MFQRKNILLTGWVSFQYRQHIDYCNPIESPPVMSNSLQSHGIVRGILQARILEWVAVSFSRVSSQPKGQTQVSCIAGRFFTSWDTSLIFDQGFDPWSRKIPHVSEQLNLGGTTTDSVLQSPGAATTEAQMPRACVPQERPLHWEAHAPQLEHRPCSPQLEKILHPLKTQDSQKIKSK